MNAGLYFKAFSRFVALLVLAAATAPTAMAQVSLSNATPAATLDFSANMPVSVGSDPGSAYSGAGFEPNPSTAGRLNSNAWAITGWSNGALTFGGTQITTNTDFTRGSTAVAVTSGGMYAYTGAPQSATDPCLMIQPGGSDWAPGTLTLRIQNNGSTNLTELVVSYNLYVRNDQARANTFNFSWSADDVSYSAVSALDYTSPAALDANGWVLVGSAPSRSTTISGLNVAPGGYVYIRWSGADAGGSGSRDEFGLDDISLSASFAVNLPLISIATLDASKEEGQSGTTPFTFLVTRAGDLSVSSSADWTVAGDGPAPANAADFGGSFPSGTVNFAPGESLDTITVSVSGDTDFEQAEGFQVSLSNLVNANPSNAMTALGSILNDDQFPCDLSISATTTAPSCPGDANGSITLSVSGNGSPFTFDWSDLPGNNDPQNRSGLAAGNYAVTVTDANQCAASISVTLPNGTDNAPPSITCPANTTIQCDDPLLPANTGSASATDNCDMTPTITYSDVLGNNGCGGYSGTLTRTWKATDDAGNMATCNQSITIIDNEAPVWVQNPLPANITVNCSMVPPPATLTATDNCTGGAGSSNQPFINEIHYDNAGTDTEEFIEIAGPAGLSLSGYSLVLYNGSGGVQYNTLPLSGTIPNQGTGTGAIAFFYAANGIQNGAPDGVALVQGSTVIQFLSYEGVFTATDGPAAGLLSTDIGVAQEPAPATGLSLQLIGSGNEYSDFSWTGPIARSPNSLNIGQSFVLQVPTQITYSFTENFTPGSCLGQGVFTRTWRATDACNNTATHTQTITLVDNTPPVFSAMPPNITVNCNNVPPVPDIQAVDGCGPTAGIKPWINEIHYDNEGADVNEFFEIAGPAGTDLSGYTVHLYNGANGQSYDIRPLSGIIPNQQNGYGALAFSLPLNGLQNGSPDGLALVQGASTVIQFLSYEGSFTATNGPANGQASINLPVAEEPAPPVGQSLQLIGAGSQYANFQWSGPATASPGSLNVGQLVGPVVVTVTFTETKTNGNCSGNYTLTRTWKATDACGNMAQMTQIVTVVDNLPPVSLCKSATIYLDKQGNATLDPQQINNGSTDQCGTVTLSISQSIFSCGNKGPNNVTLTVLDDCGNISSCVAVVTVLDTIRPTLTCPTDRIVDLDPGLCCTTESWADPVVTDNCPFTGPAATLNTVQTASNNFGSAGGTVYFDINNLTGGPITLTELGLSISNATTANVYTKAGTYVGFTLTPGAWTLTTTANATAGPFAGAGFGNGTITPAPLATAVVLQPGITGIAINTPGAVQNYVNGTGGNQTYTDGVLTLTLGAASNGLFNGNFTPRVFKGYVKYQTSQPTITATQIKGKKSGSEFCKPSADTIVYEAFDASGNRSECSFTIRVNEFANPIKNLQCNDVVQISLGEGCTTRVGADQILEGGPYGCYDDYEVTIHNAQNQPLASSPFIGKAQIGGPWTVTVTDPQTGNKCWGQIVVEDKWKPVLECRDVAVDCGENIPLQPAPGYTGPQEQILKGINEPIGEAGAPVPDVHEYSFDYSYLPAGTPVTDVDVRIKLTGHTWLPDLNIEVISPSGKVADVFTLTGCFGQEWPIDVIFDDQGQGGLTQCAQLNAGGARLQPVVAPGQSGVVLNTFNGENASGVWKIRFSDIAAGDDGVIEIAGLYITADAPAIAVQDNCTANGVQNTVLGNAFGPGQAGLIYGDDIDNYSCADNAEISQRITRVWTARDEQGNTSQCVQRIDIRRATIGSLTLPANYDDVDEASFDCTGGYPTVEATGIPGGGGCGSLQMGYTDVVAQVCQGSYTIIRSWTLNDMCTGEIGAHDQLIMVKDKTAPVVICPSSNDIKVGKSKNGGKGCTATVQLPWIQVTDNCSTNDNTKVYAWTTLPDGGVVIVEQMNAQGQYVFELPVQVAPHEYVFTYTAIDDCGNKAECTVSAAVRDVTPPTVICEQFHVVSLTDSVTLVNASSFDDGSYDECSMVTFAARRGTMNASGAFTQHPCNQPGDFLYNSQVRFYCCDAQSATELFVDLRVRDAYGNDNFCMVPVTVVDKVRPVIWCPENITVQCGMPYAPTGVDTFAVTEQPNMAISNAYANTYSTGIQLSGFPADARITDLDLSLLITHDVVNQLKVTLVSPKGTKAQVLTAKACGGQPVQFPTDIDVTFNDEAYDIATFNATGQKVPAAFTCLNAKPSVGSYNQGHMQAQGDELKIFEGEGLNGYWEVIVEDTAPLGGGMIHEIGLSMAHVLPLGLRPVVTDNTEECGLTVTHQDLGQPDECPDNEFINRRWSVADAFGNNTNCIQRIYFNDATPLRVNFPCNATTSCPSDPSNTGEATHNADCEIPGVEYTDSKLTTTDGCYKILRTWVVKDWCKYQPDGNVDYATTTINDAADEITFTTAINPLLTARKIEVGDRVTLRYVTSGTTEIGGMTEGDVYSLVRVSGTTFRVEWNSDKQQSVNITGAGTGPHVFRYANSAYGLGSTCFQSWEDDGDGYFRYVQEIKVVDTEAPAFTDCSDQEYCSFEANCGPAAIELRGEATDNCAAASDLHYEWSIDANNDGTTDITGTGSDASGSYPLGTHKITWKVTDRCGNWSTCEKRFTIVDCKNPTPVCINGLSVDLMPSTGTAEVPATALESGASYDNCTAYGKLQFRVERKSDVEAGQTGPDGDAGATVTVNCADLQTNGGVVEVVVWVGDEAGHWDYCVTTLWVQDNMGACGSGSAAALTAYTANEDGEAVEKVNVELTGASAQQQITGTNGTASFGGLLTGQSVTVTPNKDVNPLNGVSTYDLLLIQKHLLGIKSLGSPYRLIAADVNNSANISISDIIELRKMILTPGLNFKDNTSWRFVEGGYAFPNPAKPYGYPETKSFQGLTASNAANFVAVKIGDVSGDHTPNSLLGTETRHSAGTLTFTIAEQTLVAGQQYTVAVRADNYRGVQGYQYTLDFNTEMVEFVGVEAEWSDLGEANFGRAKAGEGILTTSWNGSEGVTLADGEVLYTVTFRAKANGKLSQALTVNSRVTKAEAYDANEDLLDVRFRFDGGVPTGGAFALYQNEPNPFGDMTTIGFELPAASKATLTVYDVTGKVMKVVTGDYAKGHHTIVLNRADIQGNGMLYYRLDTDRDSATRRMILAE